VKEGAMALRISSRAFADGHIIPKKYTCDARVGLKLDTTYYTKTE